MAGIKDGEVQSYELFDPKLFQERHGMTIEEWRAKQVEIDNQGPLKAQLKLQEELDRLDDTRYDDLEHEIGLTGEVIARIEAETGKKFEY